jgi:hypothetical protein
MLLFGLVCFNFYSELRDLILVVEFSAVEFLDVGEVELLSFDAAHLFPDTEALVYELLIESV